MGGFAHYFWEEGDVVDVADLFGGFVAWEGGVWPKPFGSTIRDLANREKTDLHPKSVPNSQ